MTKKPTPNSFEMEQEIDKVESHFDSQEKILRESMSLDRLNQLPAEEAEPIHKMTQKQVSEAKDIYIQPFKTIACRDKFNEDYRDEYNYSMEWVYITAQNNMILNEYLDFWTKPFAGIPYEEWKVPVNKPIWVRRHVAERIKGCKYHELHMDQSKKVEHDEFGDYVGQMVAKKSVQRLDAFPATKRKSIFMGAESF